MSECTTCHVVQPDVEMRLGRKSCLRCTQQRYSRALSNYVVAMSTDVVEAPGRWRTALCAYNEPIEWLCPHFHRTRDEAQTCLDQMVTSGGGRFPIR